MRAAALAHALTVLMRSGAEVKRLARGRRRAPNAPLERRSTVWNAAVGERLAPPTPPPPRPLPHVRKRVYGP